MVCARMAAARWSMPVATQNKITVLCAEFCRRLFHSLLPPPALGKGGLIASSRVGLPPVAIPGLLIDLRPLIRDYCATSIQAAMHDYATRDSGGSPGLVPRLRYEGPVRGFASPLAGTPSICRPWRLLNKSGRRHARRILKL